MHPEYVSAAPDPPPPIRDQPEQIHQTFAISLPHAGYSKDGLVGGIALNTKPTEPD